MLVASLDAAIDRSRELAYDLLASSRVTNGTSAALSVHLAAYQHPKGVVANQAKFSILGTAATRACPYPNPVGEGFYPYLPTDWCVSRQ